MKLQGKVALVTGGAHRIGKSLVLMLAQQGADVVVNYFSSAGAAQATVGEVEALGAQGMAWQCDVADAQAVAGMAEAICARFGGVDIIVNSASLFAKTPFPEADLTTWQRVTAISIDGPFYICNYLVPSIAAWRRGHHQYRRRICLATLAGFCRARSK